MQHMSLCGEKTDLFSQFFKDMQVNYCPKTANDWSVICIHICNEAIALHCLPVESPASVETYHTFRLTSKKPTTGAVTFVQS